MKQTSFVLLFCYLTLCWGQLLPISLKQRPSKERSFVDSDGRERIFHGVNAIVKGPPWYPRIDTFDELTSLTDQDFKILADMGLNVIRLGVMWPGVEPVQGQYNETYLDILSDIVAKAANYNIYTLLDMHQDNLSEFFCGEGIPLWAVRVSSFLSFPSLAATAFTADQYDNSSGYNLPTRQACSLHDWPTYQLAEATGSAYQALYTNTDLLNMWARMWAHVAARFKGRPEVLGIELLNEPWAGDVYKDPLLFLPGLADKQLLQGAYDILANQIRAVDPTRLIFFAGVTWANFGCGFTSPPGGQANTSVFAFHYYEPPQFADSEKFDFDIHRGDAQRLEVGMMLTEFGSPGYNSKFINDSAAADAHLLSWIMWEFKDFCRETNETSHSKSQYAEWGACKTGYGGVTWTNGVPEARVVNQLSRVYPIATAGAIQAFAYDAVTTHFTLTLSVDLGCHLPTEVVVPVNIYPKGVQATLDRPDHGVIKIVGDRVFLTWSASAQQGDTVTLTINPM